MALESVLDRICLDHHGFITAPVLSELVSAGGGGCRVLIRYHEGREVCVASDAAVLIADRESRRGWYCRDVQLASSDPAWVSRRARRVTS